MNATQGGANLHPGVKFAPGCKICTWEQICTRVQISHMNTVSKRTNVPVQAHLTSVPMISIRQRSREPFIPSFTHFIKFIDHISRSQAVIISIESITVTFS